MIYTLNIYKQELQVLLERPEYEFELGLFSQTRKPKFDY